MTRSAHAVSVTFAAGVAVLALAGCGRAGYRATPSPTAAAGAPEPDDRPSAAQAAEGGKLNAYIEGYNTLIGTFGLQQQFAQYVGQQIARKSVNDSVFVNIGWLDNAVGDLKKARAAPGQAPELDAAGDQMLAVMDPLADQLKSLNTYYESRGQLADNFARGKREDPQVIARYQQALAALPRLSDAIDVVQERRDTAALAALKRSGDAIGYDHGLAMQKAKQLMALADSPTDLADPAKSAKADALVPQIQAALADETQAKARGKGTADVENGMRNSMYETSSDRLQGMIGHYRDLRRSGGAFNHQMMVASYNDAAQQSNFGQVG